MDSLPVWAQAVISISSAGFVSSIIAIITLWLTLRQKNKELDDARLRRLNDNLLQNTRPHIEPLYVPVGKIIAKLEVRYDEYKIARGKCVGYEAKKILEIIEGEPESQASEELGLLHYGSKHGAIISFLTTSAEIMAFLEKMIDEGTVAYLTPEFEKLVGPFGQFLYGVTIVANTYLLTYQDVPEEQPKVYVLGTPEFEKEFYSSIDSIRAYIRNLALGMTDTSYGILGTILR